MMMMMMMMTMIGKMKKVDHYFLETTHTKSNMQCEALTCDMSCPAHAVTKIMAMPVPKKKSRNHCGRPNTSA